MKIDAILALISSNFTQRGEPAIADKTARAKMALEAGVDLVLELPCVFSCRNAGIFANSAIDMLAAAGVINCISFGTEAGQDKRWLFEAIADILNEEPAAFTASLKKQLAAGKSFVSARSIALDEIVPGALALLKSPNNNLAAAYIKRIREKRYPIETFHVQRMGAGFHERGERSDGIMSASAIRETFMAGDYEVCGGAMPDSSLKIIREKIGQGHAVIGHDRFWRAARIAIIRSSSKELAEIAEMNEGFENRMRKYAYLSDSLDDFVHNCSNKRYPVGRVTRYCAHTLLNLNSGASLRFQKNGPAYLKVAGANELGRRVLRMISDKSSLPVLSRCGGHITAYAEEILKFERGAAQIWEMLTDNPRPDFEKRSVPEIK